MFAVHLRNDRMVNLWSTSRPRANKLGVHFREIRRPKKLLSRKQNWFAFFGGSPQRLSTEWSPTPIFKVVYNGFIPCPDVLRTMVQLWVMSQDTVAYLALVHITLGFLIGVWHHLSTPALLPRRLGSDVLFDKQGILRLFLLSMHKLSVSGFLNCVNTEKN